MRRIIGVALVLVSAALLPEAVTAQQGGGNVGAQQRARSGFVLGDNYPNPFDAETRLPFELGNELFTDGRTANVTIRIFNILRQYVASPTALGHPAGNGTPVVDLEFTGPGRYEAFWDATDRSGIPVPAGSYIVELTVNGRSQVGRMRVTN